MAEDAPEVLPMLESVVDVALGAETNEVEPEMSPVKKDDDEVAEPFVGEAVVVVDEGETPTEG